MSEDNKIEKSHGKWHGGKGSARKDKDNSKYADNWEKIWGNKKNSDKPVDNPVDKKKK